MPFSSSFAAYARPETEEHVARAIDRGRRAKVCLFVVLGSDNDKKLIRIQIDNTQTHRVVGW